MNCLGHEAAKKQLETLIKKEIVPHLLLFCGPEGVGKLLLAKSFAKALIHSETDSHPDIRLYKPEGKIAMHSIDSMRLLCEEANTAPYSSKCKVILIDDADRMLSYSANALLKTFEEPPPTTHIFLVSSAPHFLLPTILSRCYQIRFGFLSKEIIKQYLQLEGESVTLARGSIGRAKRLLEEGDDPIRKRVLEPLAAGGFSDHAALLQCVQSCKEAIDQHQGENSPTEWEESFSAVQKEALKKDLEGALSKKVASQANDLFDEILYWFRDLHLLNAGGDPIHLFHPDFQKALENHLQHGSLLPLEKAIQAVHDAKLGLTRMISFEICLENLFLRLI